MIVPTKGDALPYYCALTTEPSMSRPLNSIVILTECKQI